MAMPEPEDETALARILLVEDEPAISDMIAFALFKAHYFPIQAPDAFHAQLVVADKPPDLILLDWMLPGASGLELAKRWRKEEITRHIPIIMLTARGEENDRVSGLETGVDDYVVKPFSIRELLARIRAVLRRSQTDTHEDSDLHIGPLRMNTATQRVYVNHIPVVLGPCEYRLLHFLMSRPERVHSRSQLLDHVWGRSVYIEERTIDVHVLRLRKALEPYGAHTLLQTVRGSGYRLSVQVDG